MERLESVADKLPEQDTECQAYQAGCSHHF